MWLCTIYRNKKSHHNSSDFSGFSPSSYLFPFINIQKVSLFNKCLGLGSSSILMRNEDVYLWSFENKKWMEPLQTCVTHIYFSRTLKMDKNEELRNGVEFFFFCKLLFINNIKNIITSLILSNFIWENARSKRR